MEELLSRDLEVMRSTRNRSFALKLIVGEDCVDSDLCNLTPLWILLREFHALGFSFR